MGFAIWFCLWVTCVHMYMSVHACMYMCEHECVSTCMCLCGLGCGCVVGRMVTCLRVRTRVCVCVCVHPCTPSHAYISTYAHVSRNHALLRVLMVHLMSFHTQMCTSELTCYCNGSYAGDDCSEFRRETTPSLPKFVTAIVSQLEKQTEPTPANTTPVTANMQTTTAESPIITRGTNNVRPMQF